MGKEKPELCSRHLSGWWQLYSYHFVDQDDETMAKAKMINSRENLNSVQDTYQDEGNLYSYHFIDQDGETLAKARNINSGSEYLRKEKQQVKQKKHSPSAMKQQPKYFVSYSEQERLEHL